MATDDDLGLDGDFDPMETAPPTKVPVSDGATKKSDNRKKVDRDDGSVASAELRQFIERIECLLEEKQSIADDIKDVKAEAKGRGYDVGAINKIIAIRKKDANERAEEEAILDVYLAALGMI